MWESSRTRWNTARSTENRRRDNSRHAHTTIAEGVEGIEGTWPLIGRRVTLSNCRRKETSVFARTGEESLSCPPRASKILSRIILERLRDALDSKLRPEQAGWLAGFRKYKSCADQIATLRIIIEQSIEWQSALYLNFIDFEKAFDSVDREEGTKISTKRHGFHQMDTLKIKSTLSQSQENGDAVYLTQGQEEEQM
ncbi:unnamed protein product [Heterobilharzia americana]|nr:unnamed protein product [Heterobilharzia americana]